MVLIGYGCGEQSVEWKVRDHTPPNWCRIYYIISGKVWYQSDGTIRNLKKGHLYIFPSNVTYTIDHNPDDPINCLWFHLDLFPILVPALIEIEPGETLIYLIRALQSEVLRMEKNAEASAALLTSLCQAFVLWCEDRKYLSTPDARIAPMLQYISEHCREPLHIQDISREFGYSPEYFIRFFHRRIGMTPHQYLVGCRMNQALQLLRQDLSINEVAQHSGYPDGKTFSNAFQQRYGLSPSTFRKFLISQP